MEKRRKKRNNSIQMKENLTPESVFEQFNQLTDNDKVVFMKKLIDDNNLKQIEHKFNTHIFIEPIENLD